MSRAFQNDRELMNVSSEAEHAIAYYGKMKIGKFFYHTLGKRFIDKADAIRMRNMLDQLGYGARIKMVSEFDPRYDVLVRNKK